MWVWVWVGRGLYPINYKSVSSVYNFQLKLQADFSPDYSSALANVGGKSELGSDQWNWEWRTHLRFAKAVFHYSSELAGNVSTIFTEVKTKCFHLDKNQTVVCYNHNRNHLNPKACFL